MPVGLCGALTTTSRVSGRRAPISRSTSRPQRCVLAQLVEGDLGAGRPADLVQALVAGPRDDGVVAGSEHDVDETEDRLLGAGEDEDVVRLDLVVEVRDLGPQERMAGRLRVAEPKAVPQRARLRRRPCATRSAIA